MPAPSARTVRLVCCLAVLALLLVACGRGDPPRTDGAAPTVPAPGRDDPDAADDADPGAASPGSGGDAADGGPDPAEDATSGDAADGDPAAGGGTAASAPPDLDVPVTLETVTTMASPVAGAVGPDGMLYLAERAGTVHPLQGDAVGPPVVDLSAETTTDSERGLLGIAFAADGRELYLSYTGTDGATRIDAVPVDGGQVGTDRREVFRLDQPFGNHNGGDLHVGPDGLLYLGLGDGGGGGDPLDAGQDLATPLGALLRIDPRGAESYGIPDDNPFLDVDGAAGEIWVYGLRNPWRFSFDPLTDEVWIADVGQSTREEINRLRFADAAGANLGWNLMEGTLPFAGDEPDDHVAPVYEYATNGPEGCAVTGGVVYRGEAIPELVGAYLYADFCNGEVRALDVADNGSVRGWAELGVDGGAVVAFVVDADGEVLVLDLGGRVSRLAPA